MKALGKGSIASFVEVALLIAWIVLLIVLAILGVAAVSYAVFMGLISSGHIDPNTLPTPPPTFRIQIAGIDSDALSDLQWTDWHLIAFTLLAGALMIVGSIIIVSRLRRLFVSFRSGEPFRRENAQHLRLIWITMVVMELGRYVLLAGFGLLLGVFGVPESVGQASFSVDSDNFTTWLSILVLIVLAEVFREGARLKEEQELTI